MDALPNELLDKILAYLTYKEQGRCLTVSRRWNRVIGQLLPLVRTVNITAKKRSFREDSSAALDRSSSLAIKMTWFIFLVVHTRYSIHGKMKTGGNEKNVPVQE